MSRNKTVKLTIWRSLFFCHDHKFKLFREENYSKSIKANLHKSVITEQQRAVVREWGGKESAGFSVSPTERWKIFRCFGYVKDVDCMEGEGWNSGGLSGYSGNNKHEVFLVVIPLKYILRTGYWKFSCLSTETLHCWKPSGSLTNGIV